MISEKEREQIKKLVSKQYDYSNLTSDKNSLTFIIDSLSVYPEERFNRLVDELAEMGFLCFTSSPLKNQITVVRTPASQRQYYLIRVILLIASLASSIYVGFQYVVGYTGSNSVLGALASSLVEFTLPFFLIILSRELTRFFVMARNGMTYSLPIFVPDPIGLGTMGFINTPRQAFRSRQAMIETGSASLIAGFISSAVVIFIGSFYSIANPPAIHSINSPVQLLSSPLVFQILFDRVMPSLGILDPMAFAGWIGLVVNSFNAFPVGYLDGGLVSTALLGKRSVYLSYVSIAAMIGLAYLYPPWAILAIFVLLLGIRGPEPLFNVSKIYVPGKVLAATAFIILLIGMVPFPYHIVNSNFEVQIQNQDTVIINGTHQNVTFTVVVSNSGKSGIVPAFTTTPFTQLRTQGQSKPIGLGNSATYNLTIPFWNVNRTGIYNYTITTSSGVVSKSLPVRVILMNLTDTLYLSENPYYTTVFDNQTINITEWNYGTIPLRLNVISFSDPGLNYSLIGSNISLPLGGTELTAFPITLTEGHSMQLTIRALSGQGNITIVTYDKNYTGTIAYITVKPQPRGSTLAHNTIGQYGKIYYSE